MAKANFRQEKRQRELARKARQTERMARRGEKPQDETPGLTPPPPAGTTGK